MASNHNGSRPAASDRARAIYATICLYPGITAWKISKKTGVDHRAVVSCLATLDGIGWLVSEDDHGGLYPFDPDMWG